MGDILPPKRQAVVDRLRRRIELFRRHQNACLPRYDQTSNGLNDQQRQDTLLLKQRFLEAKAKKAKKSEHKNVKDPASAPALVSVDAQRNLLAQPKLVKRPAEGLGSPLEGAVDGLGDENERQAKIPRTGSTPDTNSCGGAGGGTQEQQQGSQQQQSTSLPSFSVQIVQQFTSSSTSQAQHSQTIQTNVTVKALTGNIKGSESPLASASSSISTAAGRGGSAGGNSGSACGGPSEGVHGTSISVGTNIECKQERDTEFLPCSGGGPLSDRGPTPSCNPCGSPGCGVNASATDRFADAFPNLNFADDSGDDVIHPDILKDLIDDVFTNPSDLMKDFNFDDSVGSCKDQDDSDKDSSVMDVKALGTPSLTGSHFSPAMASQFTASQTQQQSSVSLFDPGSLQSPAGGTFPGQPRVQTSEAGSGGTGGSYNPNTAAGLAMSAGLGLDFKLTEPSPAAQTLKQMAEQHQSMQQKQQQQIGLGLGSPHSRSPFSPDSFSPETLSLPSLRSNFLNGSGQSHTGAPMQKTSQQGLYPTMSAGGGAVGNFTSQQTSFPTARSSTGTTGGVLFKQEARSPHYPEIDKRQTRYPSTEHKSPTYGAPSPDQKPPPGLRASPVTYSSGRSMGPYTDASLGGSQSPSALPPMPNQYMRTATGLTPPPAPTQQYGPPLNRPPSGHSLQLSQSQQLQISHNNQQLQVSQGQQLQISQDMKPLGSAGAQQHQAMYAPYPQNAGTPTGPSGGGGSPFQLSMSQSQSVTFGAQYGGGPAAATSPPASAMSPAQESILRQQMLKQQQQQQQQHHHQHQQMACSASQRQAQMQQFVTRPPPEYKPLQQSVSSVQQQQQQLFLGNGGGMMMAVNQSQAQRFGQPGETMRRGVTSATSPYVPEGPGSPVGSHPSALMARSSQPDGLQGTVGLPAYGQQPMSLGPQVAVSGIRTSASAKPVYTSPPTRHQRPPNVNVGPEGLNISQRPPTATDWRHVMLQQQQSQVRLPTNPQLASRASYARAVQPQPQATFGHNVGVPVNPMMARGMTVQQQQQSQARAALAMNSMQQHQQQQRASAMLAPTSQRMLHQQQQLGLGAMSGSSVGLPQLPPMSLGATGEPAPQQHAGSLYSAGEVPTSSADAAQLNLDFLDSIESSATDLLNFDPVIPGNAAHFTLLDEMGMLGK